MARCPIPIKVKSKDLSQIRELLRGGIQQVRVVLRALSLRQLADGFTAPQVAQALPLTAKAIRQIAHRYINDGLGAAVSTNSDREPRRFSTAPRSSASLPWSAVNRRKAGPVGRSA